MTDYEEALKELDERYPGADPHVLAECRLWELDRKHTRAGWCALGGLTVFIGSIALAVNVSAYFGFVTLALLLGTIIWGGSQEDGGYGE